LLPQARAVDKCAADYNKPKKTIMADNDVSLRVYDISKGYAKQLSTSMAPLLGGKIFDGVWHTSVVVFGREWQYSGKLVSSPASQGRSDGLTVSNVHKLGTTYKTQEAFQEFLESVSAKYTEETYSLRTNNCNHFADAAVMFLLAQNIPKYITNLLSDVLSTPLAPMITPVIEKMERELRGGIGNVDDVRDAFIRELHAGALPGGTHGVGSNKRDWKPSVGDLVVLNDMSRAEFNGAKCRFVCMVMLIFF
jgi:hypothetical protein